MAGRKIEVIITGDASSLEKAFRRAGKKASAFESGLNKASKGAAGAFVALGFAAKIGLDEFKEAEKVGAQTAAVLKSTGAAANVTGKQVEKLAGSLSRMSDVDDEAIQSGQNLLLTFTKVRNGVGKGNAVFDKATEAMLDLSVAMGTDTTSAAMLVGKALNDPIKGMAALSRAGVQFTSAQKDQAKAMIAAGDVMGAQKMILKELETQFGGSAKAVGGTFAGQLNKAKNSLEEMTASVVVSLVPALSSLAGIAQKATGFMQEHQKAVKVVALAVAGLAAAVLAVNAGLKVYRAAVVVATVAQLAWNVALTASPIGLVVVGLAALGVAFVIAWKKSETFRNVVTGVFTALRAAAAAFIGFQLAVFDKYLAGIQMLARGLSHLPKVGDRFAGAADAIGAARDKLKGFSAALAGTNDKNVTVTTKGKTVSLPDAIAKTGRAALPGTLFAAGPDRNPQTRAMAGTGGRNSSAPVHVHLNLNGREIARAVLPELQRTAKMGASSSRGRYGGGNLGLG